MLKNLFTSLIYGGVTFVIFVTIEHFTGGKRVYLTSHHEAELAAQFLALGYFLALPRSKSRQKQRRTRGGTGASGSAITHAGPYPRNPNDLMASSQEED